MNNTFSLELIDKEIKNDSFKAAYALNMCMVSVSQIVDYDDINVLEQEYETILNNLNLEKIPKDEALLRILTQLMDTITFFRISEGDKAMIEKEYAHKMKNAIWDSVPNFGVIFAGGSIASIGVSLASQIGIGYMNYRKNKANYELEKDKAYWNLQKTAIEQFNALQRELFTTAWRLADKYNFPDNFRLTERQMKEYNQILLDNDPIRRLERLEYMENAFYAYPPYWYFRGHAANEAYIEFEDSYYKIQAINCFDIYTKFSSINILREDQLLASCTLEYIDLLDSNMDQNKIKSLLDEAVKASGNAKDVLQICAFYYLNISEQNSAVRILNYLVNENYNSIINAQLLSQLYFYQAFISKQNSTDITRKYHVLASRVNEKFLFPFPIANPQIDSEKLTQVFFSTQKQNLHNSLNSVIKAIYRQHLIAFNKIIPSPESVINDNYYLNTNSAKVFRQELTQRYLTNIPAEYASKLQYVELEKNIIDVLNNVLLSLKYLNVFLDNSDIRNIKFSADKILYENRDFINITNQAFKTTSLSVDSYIKLESIFENLLKLIFGEVLKKGYSEINNIDSMQAIAHIDSSLIKICEKHDISVSILLSDLEELDSDVTDFNVYDNTIFSMAIFGETAKLNEQLFNKNQKIISIIKNAKQTLLITTDKKVKKKEEIYINGESLFDKFFETSEDILKSFKNKTAAVLLDEKNKHILLFTPVGVFICRRKTLGLSKQISDVVPYTKITSPNNVSIYMDSYEYPSSNINVTVFMNMVNELKDIQEKK